MLVPVAHCPAFGVKVYVVGPVLDVFIVAGLHVPVIPLFDVAGNDGGEIFLQLIDDLIAALHLKKPESRRNQILI